MIKRTSRNFKVPLVYGGQWKDHQTFQKWDPISKRLIQVNCCYTPSCKLPPTSTANDVSFLIISSHGGSISWTYGGTENEFEVAVYESATLPVNTNTTPVYIDSGMLTSPYAAGFTLTKDYYYVASVRVRNNCGYSPYAYSTTQQFICPNPDYIANITLTSLDGTSGQVSWGIYGGTNLEINIYEGASLPVDTSGVPIFSMEDAFTKPYTATFSQTSGYYYVASVRAINDCGYSIYSYSEPVEYCINPPNPVDSVSLTDLMAGGGNVSWVYGGGAYQFEVNIYNGSSLPVDTSGIPLYTIQSAITTPFAASFTTTDTLYYVASVRVVDSCGYSTYVYSDPIQYLSGTSYQFVRALKGRLIDPGSGNFSYNITTLPNVTVNFSKTDKNGADVDATLAFIAATKTVITLTKDISNYYNVVITSATDMGTYWRFNCTVGTNVGTVDIGDTISLSYS